MMKLKFFSIFEIYYNFEIVLNPVVLIRIRLNFWIGHKASIINLSFYCRQRRHYILLPNVQQ